MRIDSLQALYDGYLKDAIQVEKNRKPGEGIFGMIPAMTALPLI